MTWRKIQLTSMQNRKNKGCFNDGAQSSAASYDFDFGIDETTDY